MVRLFLFNRCFVFNNTKEIIRKTEIKNAAHPSYQKKRNNPKSKDVIVLCKENCLGGEERITASN